MATQLMPRFEEQPDGKTIPVWNDEADARWLIAAFLRSDIGFSLDVADEVAQGLEAVQTGQRDSWRWDGNSFALHATAPGCSIELCDSDVPAHIKALVVALGELREILRCWETHISADTRRDNSNPAASNVRTMTINERITVDPQICHGKPVIRGTRTPVAIVVGSVANGMSFEEIERAYDLTAEDIRAALSYAAQVMDQQQHPLPVE